MNLSQAVGKGGGTRRALKKRELHTKVGGSGGIGTPHQLTQGKRVVKGDWGCGVKKLKAPSAQSAEIRSAQIKKLLDEFEKYLRVRGFARTTIANQVRNVRWFCEWIEKEKIGTPLNASRSDLMKWAQTLLDLPKRRGEGTISTATQAMHIQAIRSFYGFLVRAGYLMADPAAHIPIPRTANRLPRDVPTEKEMQRILSIPDTMTARGYRDRAVMELFYGSGIRSSELRKLQVKDVNVKEEIVFVREGKGRKDRVVPIGPAAAEYVGGYIRNVRPLFLRHPKDRTVFLTVNGKRFGGTTLKEILDCYMDRPKIEKRVTPHSFRHACASHMVRNGADIRYVQELLGHESLETTEQYVRLEAVDLAEAHRKFHPRERM